jgi:hypothetical protein
MLTYANVEYNIPVGLGFAGVELAGGGVLAGASKLLEPNPLKVPNFNTESTIKVNPVHFRFKFKKTNTIALQLFQNHKVIPPLSGCGGLV